MEEKNQIQQAQFTFDKVLSFISRVDIKANAILAINTGMLAFLAVHVPKWSAFTEWYMYLALVPVILLSISFWFLYRCGYPNLVGGNSSLIYFKEIASRTESNFISEFLKLTDDLYLKDLLNQVYRNSEIAKEKYESLKYAFIFTAISIIPWVIALALFVSYNNLQVIITN